MQFLEFKNVVNTFAIVLHSRAFPDPVAGLIGPIDKGMGG